MVGAVTGVVVAGFDRLVVDVLFDQIDDLPSWLLAVLPGLGLLVAWPPGGSSAAASRRRRADEYLHVFHDPGERLGWRAFAGRMVAAVATLGSGAPDGPRRAIDLHRARRSAVTSSAAPASGWAGGDGGTLTVAGAAAGVVGDLQGAGHRRRVRARGAVPRRLRPPHAAPGARGQRPPGTSCSPWINGTDPLFPIEGNAAFGFRDLAGAVVVGVVAAGGAHGFSWLIRRAKQVPGGAHPVRTTVAAGVAIAVLFAIGEAVSGEPLVVGSGYEVLVWVSDPGRSAWVVLALLVLRGLATSATVAGGGVGGLFIPLVVAGALTGALVGNIVNPGDLDLFIVIGVAAFLGAGYRVPLAAVMFVAETTGRPSFVVPGLIAAVAAELLMGRASVTEYQLDHTMPSE